ncbi:putative tagatose 6-phosphate kinase [Ameyamaea chiangmaiensis NBRC 103196]|uniref:D-tagatose-bisphosphate aldolase, class II, non-catalytic subunit n=1 Tax=Ameyamaea chiangmaiensis TaxID=442969 RepID=A0A850P6D4_9PROT|nr:D-tagatose-bisphosphate aldolase, class II, non-catalytic subunit [Ameyamaea chiangmaiensis]MBS4075157.1 D-tagatose-bisphosphate aldolase, class II, non-catalytic subunit [Ameyamaea chiangmaiensis]NVN40205.1 D-tagatose-bisphosphate aldolase, class II, non-catalytic subunit [Ameyamaea chiangmaiensis]GBQ66261.1 putative tagatose 6-phosphate kinase [Ameyamaea chiangmaiensis NBRC 103196]
MSVRPLLELAAARQSGHAHGIVSVCSAHELVIEAALTRALETNDHVLIEATCNQVNQDGGYTGMTPADFRTFVEGVADRVGYDRGRIILGGDHLGPNPWKHLPPEDALAKAGVMIEAYARAGFEKLHLDASMGCQGEPAHLDDVVVARRAASLAARAEAQAPGRPVYVVGTEVPTPGGATEALDHLVPTTRRAVEETYRLHRKAFDAIAPDAFERVIAIVVQPGVEFGHDSVAVYRPERARDLTAALEGMPGLVFEAHSTDYQPGTALAALVRDGFPILKVGPALTFALREALYALDAIDGFLNPNRRSLIDIMEAVMLAAPAQWESHYHGTSAVRHRLRHFSYSDRIRYYWPVEAAQAAVDGLLNRLGETPLAPTLVSQYLPRLYDRVADGTLAATPRALLLQSVRDVLIMYQNAADQHS